MCCTKTNYLGEKLYYFFYLIDKQKKRSQRNVIIRAQVKVKEIQL